LQCAFFFTQNLGLAFKAFELGLDLCQFIGTDRFHFLVQLLQNFVQLRLLLPQNSKFFRVRAAALIKQCHAFFIRKQALLLGSQSIPGMRQRPFLDPAFHLEILELVLQCIQALLAHALFQGLERFRQIL